MPGLALDSLSRIGSFASLDRLIRQSARNDTQTLAPLRVTVYNRSARYLPSRFVSQCAHGFFQRFDRYQAFGSIRRASVEAGYKPVELDLYLSVGQTNSEYRDITVCDSIPPARHNRRPKHILFDKNYAVSAAHPSLQFCQQYQRQKGFQSRLGFHWFWYRLPFG